MSNHATDTAGVKARDTALQGALTQIERQFGKGTVMRMGDEGAQVKVNAIPTGALSLDLALGIGGMPRGRIVEVFGPESSGKTTLVYHVLAEAQKLGGVCAFIDAEHAMDPLYAQKIGVDIDELLVSQPDYGEQALEIADMLVRSGAVDVVAVDSVAALTPRAELEGQMGDQTVGLQARMMSQAMRKLAGNLNRTQTLCLFVNQIREKVGVMFGSPETQPGGRALKFYSSQRLDIRRIETLKDGTEAIGNRVRVKVVKNKVAAPFRQAEFDIEFGKGISSSGCILDLGIEHNIVAKSGSFFSYDCERLGQGRNNAKGFLDEHPEVAKEIEAKVYEALGIGQDLVAPIERDEDAPAARPRGRDARRAAGGRRGRLAACTWRAGPGPPRPRRTTSRRIRSTRATIASRRTARARGAAAPEVDPVERARGLAWRSLNKRDRTVDEVGGMLLGKRVEPAVADQVVTELIELGYLDDARYAQRFAEDRRRLDAWGSDRIARRLRELGVDRSRSRPPWPRRTRRRSWRRRSSCCAAAARRRPPRAPSATARSASSMRRGYAPELAFDALRRHCGAEPEPDPGLSGRRAQVCADRAAVLRSGAATDQARGPENTSKQTLSARDQAASRDGRSNY